MTFFARFVLLGAACLASLRAADAPAADHPVVRLWDAGAPGSAARMNEPEKMNGSNLVNIHHPSLTVYLPAKDMATGCAVIVAPGGAHARLAIQHEGWNVAQWL